MRNSWSDRPCDQRLREARELTAFAEKWHPFGRIDVEEVMPTFGLTPARFHARLGYVLDLFSSDQLDLSPEVHRRLRTYCLNVARNQRLARIDG